MGLFHITTPQAWERAEREGSYHPESLDTEGFIHLSGDLQLLATAERFYAGQDGLIVLSILEEALTSELRYEAADGDQFPHLYGPLNLEAVREAVPLPLGEDGHFHVPEAWKAWAHYFGREEEYDPGG